MYPLLQAGKVLLVVAALDAKGYTYDPPAAMPTMATAATATTTFEEAKAATGAEGGAVVNWEALCSLADAVLAANSAHARMVRRTKKKRESAVGELRPMTFRGGLLSRRGALFLKHREGHGDDDDDDSGEGARPTGAAIGGILANGVGGRELIDAIAPALYRLCARFAHRLRPLPPLRQVFLPAPRAYGARESVPTLFHLIPSTYRAAKSWERHWRWI